MLKYYCDNVSTTPPCLLKRYWDSNIAFHIAYKHKLCISVHMIRSVNWFFFHNLWRIFSRVHNDLVVGISLKCVKASSNASHYQNLSNQIEAIRNCLCHKAFSNQLLQSMPYLPLWQCLPIRYKYYNWEPKLYSIIQFWPNEKSWN